MLNLVGKFGGKSFGILGLDESKGWWVVEQHFPHGRFQVNVTRFFAFFSRLLAESCSFLYGLKDLLYPQAQYSG